jgi:hypothetical protein
LKYNPGSRQKFVQKNLTESGTKWPQRDWAKFSNEIGHQSDSDYGQDIATFYETAGRI